MSTPVRWIVAGVVLLLVLGLVVLYLFNMNLPMSSTEQQGGPLWVVLPGDSITLAPVEVGPDDKYLCERKGSINGTQSVGLHGCGLTHGMASLQAGELDAMRPPPIAQLAPSRLQ